MPDATIKRLDDATDVRALAERFADLAASADLILVDRVHRADGVWGRNFAFADAVNGLSVAFVAMGRHEPPLLQQTLLLAALRRKFAQVRVFESYRKLAQAAHAAWPCARSAEMLAYAPAEGEGGALRAFTT